MSVEKDEKVSPSAIYKVAFASGFGSFLEWFDFFIAATASASVWPTVFFAGVSPALAIALSIVTYGITFLTRPLGAFIFGHLGDRIGRKTMLAWTLTLMGIGSLGIALLPSTAVIGVAAPIVLAVFRIIQGIGIGGEVGGSTGWIGEFAAKSRWRGLWTGMPILSIAPGTAVATIAFLIVAQSTGNAYLAWGWRIPFVVGAIVAALGAVIRKRLQDSPLFLGLKETGKIARLPSIEVLKRHSKESLLGTLLWAAATSVQALMITPFSLGYLIALKVPPPAALSAIAIAFVFATFTDAVGLAISDIVGRRPVLIASAILTFPALYFFFPLLKSGNWVTITLAEMALVGAYYIWSATSQVAIAESFPTKYRYSGIGLSVAFGGFTIGLLVTFAVPAVIVASKGIINAGPDIALISGIMMLTGLIATLLLKETKGTEFA